MLRCIQHPDIDPASSITSRCTWRPSGTIRYDCWVGHTFCAQHRSILLGAFSPEHDSVVAFASGHSRHTCQQHTQTRHNVRSVISEESVECQARSPNVIRCSGDGPCKAMAARMRRWDILVDIPSVAREIIMQFAHDLVAAGLGQYRGCGDIGIASRRP